MARTETFEEVDILLVEDNAGDIRLTQEALRDGRIHNRLHVVRDGEAAMQFLRGTGTYRSAPRPDVVLLDLNLPRKDGREVLAEIKQDDRLKSIPVIVLTTSGSEEDVERSYGLHANSFITKPVELAKFIDVMRQIEGYWLSIVRLPPKTGRAAAGSALGPRPERASPTHPPVDG